MQLIGLMNKTNISCSVNAIDRLKVDRTLKQIPDPEKTRSLATIYKAFADPTRLRILQALAIEEHCVCDLSAVLNLSMSAISHQLRILRDHGLVGTRREGKMINYSLLDDHVSQLLQLAQEHLEELN